MKLLSIFCLITLAAVDSAKLTEVFKWKQLEFQWPCESAKQSAIATGEYVPQNNLPLGLARWENKLFLTVPRWKNGVASSLNYVDLLELYKGNASPKLIPYPSWEANYAPKDTCKNNVCEDKSTIVSAFRMQVDRCDRLWVLDTGMVDVNEKPTQVTENAIAIFDLKTDKLIRRFIIPSDQLKADTFLPNIFVDIDDSDCSKAYAYLPDLGGYGVIVYSFENNESYRVSHNFFYFDPLQGNFNVSGINFQWTDGVFAMAIGPTKADGSKDIYFHSMSSIDEFKVSNRVLQNKALVTGECNYYHFEHVGSRGENSQSSSEVYDKENNVIFYSEVNKNAISYWKVGTNYEPSNMRLLESNSETLVFINDMKIDNLSNLWVLSDKMPQFLRGLLNPNDINFRVLVRNTKNIIDGT